MIVKHNVSDYAWHALAADTDPSRPKPTRRGRGRGRARATPFPRTVLNLSYDTEPLQKFYDYR